MTLTIDYEALKLNMGSWNYRRFLVCGRCTKTDEPQLYVIEAADHGHAKKLCNRYVDNFKALITLEKK